ncbi:MAG: hypothetical protein GX452_04750, partial [Ignavibacteriales bacterium]|nr:hypothetical protein [Ignavibacteriales bacterium]
MKYSKMLILLLFFFVYNGGYSQDTLSIQIRMLSKDERPSLSYYTDSQTYPIRVHYNQNASYANDVKEYAEIAYSYICSEIGFQPPPEDDLRGGSNAYDIYIYNLGNYTNGQAIAEVPDDWEYEWVASYIVLLPGIPDEDLADIVAHEFTHACQLGYSYADFEYDPITDTAPGKWFYENVASYYSVQVNPIDNKYTSHFGTTCGPLRYPQWGLDQSYNNYDGLLWPLFLSEWKNCTNIIPLIWERMGQNPGANILEDIDYVLVNSYNSSLSEALLKYAEWRYFTGDRDDEEHFENAELYITSEVTQIYTSGYPVNNLNVSGAMGIGGVHFIDCFSNNNEVFNFSVSIDPNYTQPMDFGILEVKYDPEIDRLRKIELNSSNQGSIKGYVRGGENVVLLGLSLNSVSNLFHKFYYSISAPQERAVAFYTKWEDESSSGYLNGKLLIDGITEVNSGDYFGLSYLTNYNNHTVKVSSERLADVNYIYKHNNWNGGSSQYLLSHSFNVASTGNYDKEGIYNKLKIAIIRNSIEGLNFSNNVGIQFNDPWYLKNAQGDQSAMNDFLSVTSPYYPTGAYNQTTGGVFLDQNVTFDPTRPYYSVQAISPQDIALSQTGKTHRFYFRNWSGTSVNFQNENNPSTGVVFNYD